MPTSDELLFRIKQFAVALDQAVNCLAGIFIGGSWADETISSRAYREFPKLQKFIDTLLWFDKDHCHQAYVSEQVRNQEPPELRLPA